MEAGLGLADLLRRYAAFYLATSLLWDTMAVLGNGLLLLAFGRPALRALRRFQQRFDFEYRPAV
jgi:energy-coupling factor transport system substrate-specific component